MKNNSSTSDNNKPILADSITFNNDEIKKNYLYEKMLIEYERDYELDMFRHEKVQQSYEFDDL